MKTLLLTLCLALTSLCASAQPALEVDDAWVREAPPGAHMLAAYMTLSNPGSGELRLVGVESPAFAHVMMHKSETVDGVARMLHQDSIAIPPGGRVRLEPGSYHLMMPAPETRLVAGDTVEFLLHLDDDRCIRVQAVVKKP